MSTCSMRHIGTRWQFYSFAFSVQLMLNRFEFSCKVTQFKLQLCGTIASNFIGKPDCGSIAPPHECSEMSANLNGLPYVFARVGLSCMLPAVLQSLRMV